MQERYIKVPFLSMSATSTTQFYRVLDLRNCAFLKPRRKNLLGEFEEVKPPRFSRHSGRLSDKAVRNLRRSIHNFLISINPDMLVDGSDKDKISFLTLTLPSEQIKSYSSNSVSYWATDKEIKSKCFNQFMTELREDKGVEDFVWVCEKQLNGNLHFHVLLDRFIDYNYLLSSWNRIINKLGFVDRYSAKMRKLSFDDYRNLRKCERKSDEALKKSYDFGVASDWKMPNSVDIARLRKVDNVAAYICKYMSKGFDSSNLKYKKRISELQANYDLSDAVIESIFTIGGRIWQCSQKISKSRRCVDYLEDTYKSVLNHVADTCDNLVVHVDDYFSTFCHSFSFLKSHLSPIYEAFLSHLKAIFNNDFVCSSSSSCSSGFVRSVPVGLSSSCLF